MGNAVVKKGKIGQFFCRHKNTGWFLKSEPFFNLNGDRHYKICKDCGKQLGKQFIRHD